jgi:hypothetical protein
MARKNETRMGHTKYIKRAIMGKAMYLKRKYVPITITAKKPSISAYQTAVLITCQIVHRRASQSSEDPVPWHSQQLFVSVRVGLLSPRVIPRKPVPPHCLQAVL